MPSQLTSPATPVADGLRCVTSFPTSTSASRTSPAGAVSSTSRKTDIRHRSLDREAAAGAVRARPSVADARRLRCGFTCRSVERRRLRAVVRTAIPTPPNPSSTSCRPPSATRRPRVERDRRRYRRASRRWTRWIASRRSTRTSTIHTASRDEGLPVPEEVFISKYPDPTDWASCSSGARFPVGVPRAISRTTPRARVEEGGPRAPRHPAAGSTRRSATRPSSVGA